MELFDEEFLEEEEEEESDEDKLDEIGFIIFVDSGFIIFGGFLLVFVGMEIFEFIELRKKKIEEVMDGSEIF